MRTNEFQIGARWVGDTHPTYFIADVSANHDGDLDRAKDLIRLAAAAGADAAKFQNFQAASIVSDKGFRALGGQQSHQASWKESVFEVYQKASLPWEWTPILKAECDRAGIDYLSTPYDFGAVDMLDPYVLAYKIGSGDITWSEMVRRVGQKRKPIILATGASDMADVQRAVNELRLGGGPICLMQCNTNYTGRSDNFRHINLRVLETFRLCFPEAVLGISDHTPGHATVLGAVALGARMVEKHFTDDCGREGPDHPFSMMPKAWREMVDRTRELEMALGTAAKEVADNERDTVVLQRRCLRAAVEIPSGTILEESHFVALRPAPARSVPPWATDWLLGRKAIRNLARHDVFYWNGVE